MTGTLVAPMVTAYQARRAKSLARLLTGLRKVNRRRARLLFAALLVEVSALAVLAVAVVIALVPMMG